MEQERPPAPPDNLHSDEARTSLSVREARIAPEASVQWEMVIPKMTRPGGRPGQMGRRPPAVEPPRPAGPATELPPAAPPQQWNAREPAREAQLPAADREGKDEGLPSFLRSPEELPKGLRIRAGVSLIVVGVSVVAIAIAAYLVVNKPAWMTARRGPARTIISSAQSRAKAEPTAPVNPSGWISDFAPNTAGSLGPRYISVLRPSLNLTDFRMDFQGRIEKKALGWVFRAKDSDNFYVMKLETVKPGPEAVIALIRFAVIDGVEQPRTEIALPGRTPASAIFKVRLEAVGPRFITWIQEQKVDDWSDNHIPAGGIGTYSEQGERGSFRSEIRVLPLKKD